MVGDDSNGRLPVRRGDVPADLAATVGLVLLCDAFVLAPVLRETPVRAVLAFPLLLFLPGYAFVAALYPEGPGQVTTEDGFVFPYAEGAGGLSGALDGRRISGLERVVFSTVLSVVVLALTSLSLNFTAWGIRLVPVVVSVSTFTVAAAVVAAVRRRALPEDERFSVPFRSALASVWRTLRRPDSRTDAALNVLVVVAVLVAASSVGYAVLFPSPGERFTEFYLLTRDDAGDLLADDFPTTLQAGRPTELVVGVGNHEHEAVTYVVVGELQRVRVAGNETTVLETEPVGRFDVSLAHNETALEPVRVEPSMTGERLRLVFLLYRGEAPAEPSMSSAYRSTYLWLEVAEPDTAGNGT